VDRRGDAEVAESRALISPADITLGLGALHPGWTGDTTALARSIEFADFPTAVDFITQLAPRCEELDHHPDLGLRWRWVDVVLTTHSAGGVTALDLQLAEIVDEVAAALPLAG
jgi:4a-hydroxytetrahydrobiopterin dehydratase